MNEESLFAAALEKASGAERQAFLNRACGGDAALRRRIEMLLEADERSRGILEGATEAARKITAPQGPRLSADQLFAGRFKLRQKLGAHPDMIPMMNNLAFGYNLSGKPEKALPVLQDAMTRLEKRNFEHEYWDRTVANLIDTYERLNQFEQSEAWRPKLNAMIKEKQGPESPIYTNALMVHSQYLLKKEKWAEAESNLRECLAIRQKTEPDTWKTFNTMSVLGEALKGQKKYADSEPLLLKGYEGIKQREEKLSGDAKSLPTQAVERLVQLYDSWGKPDQAAKWRKELDAARLREKNRGP